MFKGASRGLVEQNVTVTPVARLLRLNVQTLPLHIFFMLDVTFAFLEKIAGGTFVSRPLFIGVLISLLI